MKTLGPDCSVKIGAIHHLTPLGTDNLDYRKKSFQHFQNFLVKTKHWLIKMAHLYEKIDTGDLRDLVS
jgi:hypothetical protein